MKYVLGVLGVIIVAILAIVLITRGGGDKKPADRPVVVSKEAREGVSAVFTQYGQVVGEDQRRAIRITVNQNERRLEILTGFGEAVERAQSYPNTFAAFENFLLAIDGQGFNRSKKSLIEDQRAVCPLGNRFDYRLLEYSQPLVDLWSTTCGKKIGTFDGSRTNIQKLFQLQIPDYRDQIREVSLSGQNKPEENPDPAQQ